jgi:hypothetical protein
LDGFLGVESTSAGVTSAEGLRQREAGRAPFQLRSGILFTTDENHGKPQSGQEQPQDHSLRRLACLLREYLDWPTGQQIAPVTQVTSVSPRSAQVPPQLPY